MNCRFCQSSLKKEFIDLGVMSPANSYISEKNKKKKQKEYPLRILICEKCWLIQTEDFANKTEFFSNDYAYFYPGIKNTDSYDLSSYGADGIESADDVVNWATEEQEP